MRPRGSRVVVHNCSGPAVVDNAGATKEKSSSQTRNLARRTSGPMSLLRTRSPNHRIQRTGASHLGQSQFVRQRRLAPVADAGRYAI
jgi:hypothetical protein